MAAETPDSLMQTLQGDRRPAIWPWLVMPLVALSLFYWFYSLDQVERAKEYGPAPGAHAQQQPADLGNP